MPGIEKQILGFVSRSLPKQAANRTDEMRTSIQELTPEETAQPTFHDNTQIRSKIHKQVLLDYHT
jgi:hypothetical protein